MTYFCHLHLFKAQYTKHPPLLPRALALEVRVMFRKTVKNLFPDTHLGHSML